MKCAEVVSGRREGRRCDFPFPFYFSRGWSVSQSGSIYGLSIASGRIAFAFVSNRKCILEEERRLLNFQTLFACAFFAHENEMKSESSKLDSSLNELACLLACLFARLFD